MIRFAVRWAVLSFLVAAAASAQWAGRVKGRVVDVHGRPLAGADVRIRSSDSGALEYAATTADEGGFEIMVVDVFLSYDLSIAREGYAAYGETLNPGTFSGGIALREVFLGRATAGRGVPAAADVRADAVAVFNSGITSLLAGDRRAADRALQLALEIDPSLREARVARLRILVESEDWERAVAFAASLEREGIAGEEFEELRDRAREGVAAQARQRVAAVHATFLEALGAIRDEELARAEELLTRVVEQDPRHAEAFYERGMIFLGSDRLSAATRDLRRYLELSPRGGRSAEVREILGALGSE